MTASGDLRRAISMNHVGRQCIRPWVNQYDPEFKRDKPIPRSVRSSLPTVDRRAIEIVRRSCWFSLASWTVSIVG